MNEIAVELDISFSLVRTILAESKIELRSKRQSVGALYTRDKTMEQLKSEIEEHIAKKLSWDALANEWGCGVTTVRAIADQFGLLNAKPPIPIVDWSDEKLKAEILKLETQGLSTRQMAAELGIGRSTLWRRLFRLFPERYESTKIQV